MNTILNSLRAALVCLFLVSINVSAQNSRGNEISLRDRIFEKPEKGSIISKEAALQWLRKSLDPGKSSWKQIKESTDELGFKHINLQQVYDNKTVLGAEIKLHFNHEGLYLVNGFYSPIEKLDNELKISEQDAVQYALESNPSKLYIWDSQDDYPRIQPELVIVPSLNDGRQYSIAYKIDVYSLSPLFRYTSYIETSTGIELLKHSRIHNSDANATGNTMYRGTRSFISDSVNATTYNLKNTTGGGIHTVNMSQGTYYEGEFEDADNNWTDTNNNNHAALDAHWGATLTYNYFSDTHSRSSYDDNDAEIKCRVHYDANYVNAFWDGTQLTFGDGYSPTSTPLTTLAIVGHEFTHGVVENTAGLVYSYESGALNESFADIFGICIDYTVDTTQADYLIGDEIYTDGSFFRNMSNPNVASHPDTYSGTHWYTGSWDNGGVHTNSGVQNFWFYLLAEGGSGTNDNSDSYTISGLGRLKASKIAYRSLNLYLSSNSDYDDARTHSIQAAIDLYGTCSDEVIATTNAWHAVGVGEIFDNSVLALYEADETNNCQLPFTVNFTNSSTNASSYIWDFGDGDTSSLASPSHTYTTEGNFDVQLIITGIATCDAGNDTLLMDNYIQIDTNNAPIESNCNITVNQQYIGYDIISVNFDSISNTTTASGTHVEDFSCSNNTSVVGGVPTNIAINSYYGNANQYVYIDYNNSGTFSSSELVTSSTGSNIDEDIMLYHTDMVFNTALRMRIVSTNEVLTGSCANLSYGQQEDYTVTILTNNSAPISAFTVDDDVIVTNQNIQFSSQSQNIPTSWSWSFPGAVPSSSTAENPIVSYASIGDYDVQLITTNSHGSDTLFINDYINVSNTYLMCTDEVASTMTGILYDSGGPNGNYSNYENCEFLIGADCVDTIIIDINSLDLIYSDNIRIYKGDLALSYNQVYYGYSSTGQQIIITEPYALIKFYSNSYSNSTGFDISWTNISLDTDSPDADFTYADTIPVNYPWDFVSMSSSDILYYDWSINNVPFSEDSIATFTFDTAGTYTIRLIGSNCNYSDTMSYDIYVQDYPELTITPDTIFATVDCGSSIVLDSSLLISNASNGEAYISLDGSANSDTVNILAMINGVSAYQEWNNTVNILNQYYPKHILTELNSTNLADFNNALNGIDVIFFPEIEYYSVNYSAISTSLQNFVNDGGNVIFGGRASNYLFSMTSTGLIDVSSVYNVYGALNVELPNDELLDSVTTPINFSYYTFGVNFTNNDFTDVLSYSGYSVVSYKEYGNGMIYYVGFDFENYYDSQARILSNVIGQCKPANTISTDSTNYIVSGMDSMYIPLNINTDELFAGTYSYSITVNTNDSIGSYDVPMELTVDGIATLELDTSCIVFAPIFANAIDSSVLVLSNTSCTEIELSSIYLSNNSEFSLSNDSMNIAPYATDSITIYFSSDTVSLYDEQLTLITQNDSITLCISAETTPPPNIEVTPNTIPNMTVSCYDEVSIDLTVYNTGLSDLIFETEYDGSAAINIVSFSYGAYSSDVINFKNALTASGLNYHLFNYDGTYTDSVDHYLTLSNVVVIPHISYYSNIFDYYSIMDQLEDFVSDGGHLITLGNDRYEMYNSDLFTGNYNGYVGSIPQPLTEANDSYLLSNTTAPYTTTYETFYQKFTNSNRLEVLYYNNDQYQAVSEWNYGDGTVCYLGFSYYNSTPTTEKILRNAVTHYNTSADFSFLPDTGIVAAGDSMNITLTIDVTNFPTGTNYETVIFHNNDPDSARYTLDFTIIKDVTPCPNFYARDYVHIGDTVSFFDQSLNSPTNWEWVFENGSPDSAFVQNPIESFYTAGLHDVSLEVSNTHGSYGVTKEDFIRVDYLYNMCDSSQANTPTGVLFDSGGEDDNYSTYESCNFLINPSCADSILIKVEELLITGSDYLKIYDGTSSSGNVLYDSGTNPDSDEVISTSGAAYVTFTSSYYVSEGFAVSWDAYIPDGIPGTASFTMDDNNPAFGDSITFTSTASSDTYIWQWSFGDGNWSNDENPKHSYTTPGSYEVMFIARNCYAPDTSYSTVTVQDYAGLKFSPDSNYVQVNCNEVDSFLLIIEDTLGGDLNYNLQIEATTIVDSSIQYLTYSGEGLYHQFYDLPTDLDSLKLEIRMNGDYSSSYEYMWVYIENIYYTTLYGGYDGVESVYNFVLTGTDLQGYLADGIIEIETDNSSSVNYYSSYENSNKIYIEYGNEASAIATLPEVEMSNSLTSGESDSIWVSLNLNNYSPGTYETYLGLVANDSLKNHRIPLVVEVLAVAELTMDTNCLDFETVIVGDSTLNTISVINTGCVDIQITDITSTNPNIYWSGGSSTLSPSNSQELELNYYAITNGTISGDITIETDAGNFTKCLDGEVILGPVASFSAGILAESLDCTSPTINQQTFTIDNIGDRNLSLEYNGLSQTVNGVFITPNNITVIAPGQSANFVLSITPGLINESLTNTEILFNTNMENQFAIPLIIEDDNPELLPTFDYTVLNISEVHFSNTTNVTASSIEWNFGDGENSTETNPSHTYTNNGSYIVTMTVTDDCGDSFTTTNSVDIQGISITEIENKGSVYPNPTNGILHIDFTTAIDKIKVFTVEGKLIHKVDYGGNMKNIDLDLGHISVGNYLLHIYSNEEISIAKIILN